MYLVHGSSNCKRIYTAPLQMWVGLSQSQLRWWPDWVFCKPWWLKPVRFQGQVHSDEQLYSDSIAMVNWMEVFNYLCDLKNPVTHLYHVASWQVYHLCIKKPVMVCDSQCLELSSQNAPWRYTKVLETERAPWWCHISAEHLLKGSQF
jgi:hypothetical protein